MGQLVLTDDQKKVLALIGSEENLSDFYLSGGTALAAFYFEHRYSDDLDFFTSGQVDTVFLTGFMRKVADSLGAKNVRFEKLYDRRQFFLEMDYGDLKIEFTKYPFKQFETPGVLAGVKVDSLRDVSSNKLMAMLDRFDPKDFVDLYYILQNRDIQDLKSDAEKKFGNVIEDIFLGGELAKVMRIEALPRMTKDLEVADLKSFFENVSKTLKPTIF